MLIYCFTVLILCQQAHCDSLFWYSSGEQQPSSHHANSHLPKLLSKASRGLEKPLILCSITEESQESTRAHTLQVSHTCAHAHMQSG